MKKTIYITLIVLAGLAVVIGAIWYLFFRPEAAAPTAGPGFTVPGQGPAAEGKLKSVHDRPVVSANYNSSQGLVLFYDFDGQLWEYSGSSGKNTASQSPISDLAGAIWSANLKHIVKTGENESSARYMFSDFTKNILANLRSGIKSAAFSPDGRKIAYYAFESQKTNSLLSSDPDGRNQRILSGNFKLRDVVLSWPKSNLIGITTRPSGLVAGSLWIFNTGNLTVSKVIGNIPGLETLYSPDGSIVLYSYVDQNGFNPKLAIVDKKGATKELGMATLVDKCAWLKDSANILCAVPSSWPNGTVFPDDYYKKISLTNDSIWKIDVNTGEKELVAPDLGDASNLMAGDGNVFYFVSRNNQLLYQYTP